MRNGNYGTIRRIIGYVKMKSNLIQTISNLIHTYKYGIIKLSVPVLFTAAGCFISFTAGRSVSRGMAVHTEPDKRTVTAGATAPERLKGEPSFAFPPYASYSDATPSNAEIMSPSVLNLAYIYEEGTDSTQPSDSYAGRLYRHLTEMDAKWSSGIYDLYNYTPERLAAQLGLPVQAVTTASGVIPKFKNVSVQFVNGDGQNTGGTSNARSIVAMANTLHYYGLLNDMEQMKSYATRLWQNSHQYSVQMGNVYYCDGSCLESGNTADEDSETLDSSGMPNETTAQADDMPFTGTSDTDAQPVSISVTDVPPADTSAADARATDPSAEDVQTTDTDAQTAEAQPAAEIEEVMNGGQQADVGCPGHVDFSIVVKIKGISEENGLFKADVQSPGTSGWTGWDETSMGWVKALSEQDWSEQYGLNTTDLFVRNPLTSAEIDIYMSMVPEDASQMKQDFIRYALSSVGKIPYYWGGKPTLPGYTGNNFGSVTAPDEDGRFLSGLDCSGWINWVYWSVTGRGLGAEGTGTLINSGRAVSKSELLPGDICVRTGPSAHVVIFLGWTADGQMLCIQETSGSVNNVEVGITTPDWQSYRRIIE